ncbi:amidohydrolase family protein, partial [Enterocloster asparagiformis]
MKIIDAHLHFCPGREYFDGIAVAAGHENTEEHLREEYRRLGIVHGIVMGNRGLDCREHRYPKELRYCVGIDTEELEKGYLNREELDRIEENLRLDTCAGIKLYPGYTSVYVSDPIYDPVYELAASYKKPVAIHTGATAG